MTLGGGVEMILILTITVSAGCFFLLRFLGALQVELRTAKQAKPLRKSVLMEDPSHRWRIHLAKPKPKPTPKPQEEEPCATYYFSA